MDVIVVGAGTAGSVVARRLADSGAHVTVLEAGGPDTNPAIHNPARAHELWHGPEDWNQYTIPQAGAANRRLHLPRGKVLGGSHALNAMIWVRGAPADYDGWGQPGWAWTDVEPLFNRIEKDLLEIIPNTPLHPVQQSILDAAVRTGLPFNPNYNGPTQDGVSIQQITARGPKPSTAPTEAWTSPEPHPVGSVPGAEPKRHTTWQAYAKPAAVTVHTGAHVHRLIITHGRCRGVVATINAETRELRADLVVLAAGALGSPTILLRSGIGPAQDLRNLGIPAVADLPVGRNLHDHLLCPVIFAADRREVVPSPNRSPTQIHWFWRSDPSLAVPDTQPICFSVPMYEPWMTGPETGFSLMAGIVSPRSRGALTLSTPDGPPLIDLAALQDPADFESLRASVEQCREVGHAVNGWGARELYPGDVENYVRRTVVTYHHQVGTCAMGTVVDPTLKVHGIEGLRVADASVMPMVTTGNTNAPAVLIGEQAARFVLG
jgi:choline dehydrogenase